MAVITETSDSTINAYASGSYNIVSGDTFTGTLTPTDTEDGINLNGLTIGETYTVSVTVDNLADVTGVVLINHANFHSIAYYVIDGVSVTTEASTGWIRDFVVTSPLTIVGNTISFNFTPLQHTSLAFQVQNNGVTEAYSVTLAPAILGPIITEGEDIVVGESGDDSLSMLGGNDQVDGGAGNDTLNGNAGDDTLTGGADNDQFVIDAANGADVITDLTLGEDRIDLTSLGINAIEDLNITDSENGAVINFGDGNQVTLEGVTASELTNAGFILADNIVGGTDDNDKTNGKSGVDIMTGGLGDDQLDGKVGNDMLDGGAGKDKLTGGLGNDTAIGGGDNDLLEGGAGDDLLDGGNQNDRLYGDEGVDTLNGDQGNDKLFGGDGDDILNGGTGRDDLTGGAGADIFVFDLGSHKDTVFDFQDGQDMFDLSALAAMGINGFGDIGVTQAGVHTQIIFNGANYVTLLDTDASAIDASDFIF